MAEEATDGLLRTLADRGTTAERLDVGIEDMDRGKLAARIAERAGDGSGLAGVLCLWALDDSDHPDLLGTSVGSAGGLVVLQALHDLSFTAPLWMLTRGAVSVSGSDHLTSPGQAQTWGWGRAAALEHPDLWGGLIDLPARLDDRALRRVCQILADPDGEDQLAVRSSGVFVRRLVRGALGDRTPPRQWTPRGTVLVTGGTGGIGGHLARWLARNGAEHLVLTSRRGREALGAPELEAVLTEMGVRVTIAACDVADKKALSELVRQVEAEGPPIRAVIHTAAHIALGMLAETTPADYAEICRAKVLGAQYLDELFDKDTLDAFVLFSSIASVWGSGDHGAYAASNAHLDALAEERRGRGLPTTSVSWGIWDAANDWDPLNTELRTYKNQKSSRHGLPLLDAELAFAALQQSLDHDETFVAVADVDWEQFVSLFTMVRDSRLITEIPEVRRLKEAPLPESAGTSAATGQFAEKLVGLSRPEQEHLLLDLVRAQAATVLGHGAAGDEVEAGRAFRDMGFDSLTAVELRNRLEAQTGLKLPATLVFDYPSPTHLAARLLVMLAPEDSAAKPVLGQLAELEAALGALEPDESTREDVAKRLQNLLWRWNESASPAPSSGVDGDGADAADTGNGGVDVSSASADELFNMIDRELGLP
ncbi:Erythronolide synthase, modules 5 and 6 [Streptomyces sp. MP131-18]|nr:Erythronolide synthase, modules 5 and 6 [Streptomyces sp. MP131-18]